MKALWPAFFLWLLASFCQADEIQDAVIRLEKVKGYGIEGGARMGGTLAPGEKDYRLLLSSPNAEKVFEAVYRDGNPQAKMYALTALKKLDFPRFQALAMEMDHKNPPVTVFGGCVVWEMSARDVLIRLRAQPSP